MDARVGLVLTGGGARGAYEAGALSVLLPELEQRGERPSVLVGTSVGAINVSYLAAAHHLSATEATAGLIERWREVSLRSVVRPIISEQLPMVALRYLGDVLSLPGVRLQSLLDAAPLTDNLSRWNDWEALRRNVDDGSVEAVAVVATALSSGRAVVFCDTVKGLPAHRSHVLDYVAAELAVEHVAASAAIPVLFAPVRVEHPESARGWYSDGGTRLNAPIKPALDLGSDHLVIVGTASLSEPDSHHGRHDSDSPGMRDSAVNLLNGAMLDTVVEDLRTLGNINTFFADADPGAQRYREARGKRPYQQVHYMFIGPGQRGTIGALAAEIFHARYGGLRAVRSVEFTLLHRLLGGDGPNDGELLSYLFFDPEFIEALIALGADDARMWMSNTHRDPNDPWQIGPLAAFSGPSRT